jgi:hypothetical protein
MNVEGAEAIKDLLDRITRVDDEGDEVPDAESDEAFQAEYRASLLPTLLQTAPPTTPFAPLPPETPMTKIVSSLRDLYTHVATVSAVCEGLGSTIDTMHAQPVISSSVRMAVGAGTTDMSVTSDSRDGSGGGGDEDEDEDEDVEEVPLTAMLEHQARRSAAVAQLVPLLQRADDQATQQSHIPASRDISCGPRRRAREFIGMQPNGVIVGPSKRRRMRLGQRLACTWAPDCGEPSYTWFLRWDPAWDGVKASGHETVRLAHQSALLDSVFGHLADGTVAAPPSHHARMNSDPTCATDSASGRDTPHRGRLWLADAMSLRLLPVWEAAETQAPAPTIERAATAAAVHAFASALHASVAAVAAAANVPGTLVLDLPPGLDSLPLKLHPHPPTVNFATVPLDQLVLRLAVVREHLRVLATVSAAAKRADADADCTWETDTDAWPPRSMCTVRGQSVVVVGDTFSRLGKLEDATAASRYSPVEACSFLLRATRPLN